MNDTRSLLPELEKLLGLSVPETVLLKLQSAVELPVQDLMGRSKKSFRKDLILLGMLFAKNATQEVPTVEPVASRIVELLHAGSLIVDDIEDDSSHRRGKPTLHRSYGLAVALNAGNYLYFWPLELVRSLELPSAMELEIYRRYHRALLMAHLGQALDVGTRVDALQQEEIAGVCQCSLKLKTGALTSFSLVLGAILAGADGGVIDALEHFGNDFGVGLQMWDDLGNFIGIKDPQKKWEDLRLKRPSWIWAHFSEILDPRAFGAFQQSVAGLPNERPLGIWIDNHQEIVQDCQATIRAHLARSRKVLTERLNGEIPQKAAQELQRLEERLCTSYV